MKPLQSVLGGVGTILGGAGGGGGGSPPPPPPPAPIPTEDEEAVKAARKRRLQEASARSGRASTILSGSNDTSDRLGG